MDEFMKHKRDSEQETWGCYYKEVDSQKSKNKETIEAQKEDWEEKKKEKKENFTSVKLL